MEEHKIGEHITLEDGREVEVMEDAPCIQCVFHPHSFRGEIFCKAPKGWYCTSAKRNDHKNIIFQEVK